jgi:hypothetical protein
MRSSTPVLPMAARRLLTSGVLPLADERRAEIPASATIPRPTVPPRQASPREEGTHRGAHLVIPVAMRLLLQTTQALSRRALSGHALGWVNRVFPIISTCETLPQGESRGLLATVLALHGAATPSPPPAHRGGLRSSQGDRAAPATSWATPSSCWAYSVVPPRPGHPPGSP